jgi:phosphoribosyl-ATP pyrophosphohydrolase
MAADENVLQKLYEVIESRKGADPDASYTARLFGKGTHKIAQKIGEEAVEAAIAAVAESQERLVKESADLIYHLMVLWVHKGLMPTLVWDEIEKRFGTSVLAIKEIRKKKE